MTKAQKAERDEAIRTLREWLPPGSTVYTSLRHVSRSGMQREISLHFVEAGEIRYLSGMAARAMGDRTGKRDGIVIGGCGMDMGFALVYDLSHTLYGKGYQCLGKREDGRSACPSNYHVNHRDRVRCEGTRKHNPDGPDFGSFCYRSEDVRGEATDIGDGETLPGPRLYVVQDAEDGPERVCPTCKGAGELPNPEGPERWDLVHTDGYALRHRWI